MEIWPFSWHEKQSTSRLNHDFLKNRLDLVPFPPLDCFFPRNGGEEMERDTVMIGIVMDANINWIAFFSLSLLGRLLHRKTHYTFTSSKGHSNFYHTHFGVAESGKRGRTKLKQPLKTKKMGLMQFQESKWVGGLRCYRALVWSQLLLSLFLSLPWPSLFLSHFLFPLLWLWAYELALALPHYTPNGALKRQGRRS